MRLLIADDHELLRDMLQSYLQHEADIELVVVATVEDALSTLASSAPFDLVLLDYAMPGTEGLDGLQRLLCAPSQPPVALISGLASADVVRAAIKLGARGFLHKSMSARSLLNAIRFMARGERFVPVDFMFPHDAPTLEMPAPATLTEREYEVLRALCAGKTNKQIALDLGLREPTIKLHVKTLYRRLGANNRTQAAMVARSRGMI
ncbi:MAG: response regulator transcription factor [Rhodobacteraceae bacterium]|nr:response regulator transcription factor [Paracoccaceae bacterium]